MLALQAPRSRSTTLPRWTISSSARIRRRAMIASGGAATAGDPACLPARNGGIEHTAVPVACRDAEVPLIRCPRRFAQTHRFAFAEPCHRATIAFLESDRPDRREPAMPLPRQQHRRLAILCCGSSSRGSGRPLPAEGVARPHGCCRGFAIAPMRSRSRSYSGSGPSAACGDRASTGASSRRRAVAEPSRARRSVCPCAAAAQGVVDVKMCGCFARRAAAELILPLRGQAGSVWRSRLAGPVGQTVPR